ncbi:required for drug-induced death protein 1 [Ambystoma mexicanum]|uniref:required for drug-induced death protein 1 n=1 Tax=Ambystoma mexicanum TaxID=8296 RepID=UPI0037E77AF0
MRLKKKARYPRQRPGEDQASILAEEHPMGGRAESGDRSTSQQVQGRDPAAAPGPERTPGAQPQPREEGRPGKNKKPSSKKVHLAPLPDRYEPLVEGGGEQERKEEKKYKRKQKARKYAKNVGKALQTGCRFLLIGFQELANAYSSPWSVSTAVVAMGR